MGDAAMSIKRWKRPVRLIGFLLLFGLLPVPGPAAADHSLGGSVDAELRSGDALAGGSPETASIRDRSAAFGAAEFTVTETTYGEFAPMTDMMSDAFELVAVDDTHTRDGTTAETNGAKSTMNVKSNSSGSDIRRAYLKFELPAFEGLVEQAWVKVFVDRLESSTPDEGYDVAIYGIYDDSWNEETLEESNRPAEVGTELDRVRVNSATVGSYIAYNVTEFVKAHPDAQISFYLQSAGPASRGAEFRTKEHKDGTPPLLTITVTPFPVPDIPANVAAAAGSKRVELTWDAADGAVTYVIERSADGEPFTVLDEIAATTYVDASVLNDVAYTYRVKAKNPVYESGYSELVTVVPKYPLHVEAPEFTDLSGERVAELAGAGFVKAKLEIRNNSDRSYDVRIAVAEVDLGADAAESGASVRKTIQPSETAVVELGFNLSEHAASRAIAVMITDNDAPGNPELDHPRVYFAD
jgi:fibronectin type 3 domain-containing protein